MYERLLVCVLVPLSWGLMVGVAHAQEPSPREVLATVEGIVAPPAYEARIEMVAHRPGGDEKRYVYRVWKKGDDRLRLDFDEPRVLSGHSALRRGDDLFRYIPSLRRSMRISAREDFEGGDFRNADILRVNLSRDYSVTRMQREDDQYVLDLEARSREASYDRVRLWVRARDLMPVQQHFFTRSGRLLRTLSYGEPRRYGDHVRPSRLVMRNAVTRGSYTVLRLLSFDVVDDIRESRFRVDSLGR